MAAINIHYKKHYTDEEREECFQWFDKHMDQLPQTLEGIRSIRISDLPFTVSRMVSVLRNRMTAGRTFNGQFSILLLIREKLREQGFVKD